MSDPSPADQRALPALSILDAESVLIAGGKLEWVPVRRSLGVRAFGVNAYRAASAGDAVIEEHVESPGQEELYLVVRGSARFTVDGESLDAQTGMAVFVERPEASRSAQALEAGTVVLALGGWTDRAYAPLPWEPIYMAQEEMRLGDWAGAARTLEREAGEQLGSAYVQYRLAYCYARCGAEQDAIAAIVEAVEINPGMLDRAADEPAFESLRTRDDWPRSGSAAGTFDP